MTAHTDILEQAYQDFLTSPAKADYYASWVILGPGPVIHDAAPSPGAFVGKSYPEPYAVIFVSDPGELWATL